jgi:hypothetical protein
MINYLQLIRAIKRSNDCFMFRNPPYEIKDWLERMARNKTIILLNGTVLWAVKYNPPSKRHTDRIQVCHWHNEKLKSSERFGKHAGASYPVVSRKKLNGTEYVTYELMTGKHHTINAKYTKAVA